MSEAFWEFIIIGCIGAAFAASVLYPLEKFFEKRLTKRNYK